MFENSLAKVLENPTDHDLPNYSPEAQKRMNSLSVAGKRNVIHPLVPREMKTRGGEALLPEKLQDFFALRLADSNALQRLGMLVDQDLEGTVAFAVQSGVPTAAFRNNSNRTQSFQAHQMATKTYEVCAVSISLKFPYHIFRNHKERLSRYLEEMLLSEDGRVLEAACLTGTGSSGQPQGIIVNAEATGSAASIVNFPTGGMDVPSLQSMLEDLAGKKAGIQPDSCGWLVGEAIYKSLQGLSDPSGKLPLVSTVVRNNKITKTMMGLPLEVSSNMPATKVLLANFKQACRLLFWSPGVDIIVNPYTGTGQVECVAQMYTNLALPRPELVVLGR